MADSGSAILASSSFVNSRAFLAIGVGGLIVGVLDLIYAILAYSPHRPILVPQTIASGLLGAKSYQAGVASAALGIILHFVISFGAATTYYLASRKLTFLTARAILFGLLYGAAVYLFMHLIVLPLSAAPHSQTRLIYAVPEFVEHWFCVGLPIAMSVRHYSP